MASTNRSSPNSKNLSQALTQSEPDINSAILMSENVNTNRNKRPRQDSSPQSESKQLDSHKMLVTWKKDQDEYIKKMLESQTVIMAKLTSDIGEIKAQNSLIQASNTEIGKSNAEIMQSMSFLNSKFEEMKKEIEDLKKERQDQRNYIENLEKKIQDLQYRSRSSAIEIRNIPQVDTETNASLQKIVCSIGEVTGVRLNAGEIRDIYRLPGKSTSPAHPRPLIAEFTSVQTKQKIVSAVRSYNKNMESKENKLNTEVIGIQGKRQPVYVAEQLPASSKKLFYQAREFAKNIGYKFCWITNGNIFLRKQTGDKQILVKTEKCLQNLETGI